MFKAAKVNSTIPDLTGSNSQVRVTFRILELLIVIAIFDKSAV